MENLLNQIDNLVWGVPLLMSLVGTGIYLTIRLKLLQILKLPLALKYVFKKMRNLLVRMQKEMFQVLEPYVQLFQLL